MFLTASLSSDFRSNAKISTFSLQTSRMVTEQNVAKVVACPFSLWPAVLAKIMLTRLLEHVADFVLPESQCGFRRGRSKIDIFITGNCRKNVVTYTWPSLIQQRHSMQSNET